MGRFTIVIHPGTGAELPFQTGHDDDETFRVGDPVDGRFHDGAYATVGAGRGYFVIIKQGQVDCVVDALAIDDQEAFWRQRFGIAASPT